MLTALLLLAAQNVEHHFDVDRALSLIDWDITSPSYTINESPDKFRLDGGVRAELGSSGGAFVSGRILGALMLTVPSVLHGEVPNPIPFLPPLATFDIEGLQLSLASAPFSINPADGSFTAVVTMVTTAGTITTGGLLGNQVLPAFGIVSPPSAITGAATQAGGVAHLRLDLDVNVTQTIGTDTFTLVLDGPIHADAVIAAGDPPTLEAPIPMLAGASATVNAKRMTPGAPTFLAGSLSGLGSTTIGALGVTLSIDSPVKVGPTVNASASGAASWTFTVPALLSGRSVWLQALQNGVTTQVAATFAL